MSSSTSNVAQNGQQAEGYWPSVSNYLVPPIAASVAIVLPFYGLIAKSAQQLEKPIPWLSPLQAIKAGMKAAPTVGVIVGTQMGAQRLIEKGITKLSNKKEQEPTSSAQIVASSVLVGMISVPPLAALNGQTMGKGIYESIRSLSAKESAAIVTRETSFLLSLRITDKVSEYMKYWFGNKKSVEYGSAFASGAIGSVIGHIPDTALTRWQAGMKVDNLRQLRRGAPIKALTLGCFSVLYQWSKEGLGYIGEKIKLKELK